MKKCYKERRKDETDIRRYQARFQRAVRIRNEAAVHTLPEESKYRTMCVMAVDMRESGCSTGEIKKWLKVSRREVKNRKNESRYF